MTVRLLPSNRTRLPWELGWRRPASSTTPALTNSSLNFWYAAIASGVGGVAASLWLLSLAIISTRTFCLLFYNLCAVLGLGLWGLTHPSNDRRSFRHGVAPDWGAG